jgi:hypothetical protein
MKGIPESLIRMFKINLWGEMPIYSMYYIVLQYTALHGYDDHFLYSENIMWSQTALMSIIFFCSL